MKVKLNKMNLVANWSWQLGDNDHCTICMSPFECACPQCKCPGDDCPPIEGRCGHIFHLHCIYKWLDSGTDKCPLDREVWKVKSDSEVNNRKNQNEINNSINNDNNINNQDSGNNNEVDNINSNNQSNNNLYYQNNAYDNYGSSNNNQDDERRIQIEEALYFSPQPPSPNNGI